MSEPPRSRLPIPIAGFTPVFAPRRIARPQWWRGQGSRVAMVIGIASAIFGAWLAQSASQVPVYARSGTVWVGNHALTPTGGGEYDGDAAAVMVQVSPTVIRAGASANVNGSRSLGLCLMTEHSASDMDEACSFMLAGKVVGSTDHFNGQSWARRYSDGREVTIPVPSGGSVIPVPFPVGR